MKVKYISELLITTAIWGFTFPLQKLSVAYISPSLLIAIRFLIGALAIFLIFPKRILNSNRDLILSGFFIGIFLFFGYYFQVVGIIYTSAINSSLITGLYVIISPILAFFILKEKIDYKVGIALILALFGLIMVTGFYQHMYLNLGDLLTVISAISYSFQVVFVDKYSKIHDPIPLTFYQVLIVVPFSIMFIPVLPIYSKFNFIVYFSIFYLSLFATTGAILLQNLGQKGVDSATASMVFAMEPVFGVIFSMIVLGEAMNIIQIFGSIFLVFAMIIVSLKKNQ
ncbi:MAG: DMT family transporter [Thermoplasmata archaeon]